MLKFKMLYITTGRHFFNEELGQSILPQQNSLVRSSVTHPAQTCFYFTVSNNDNVQVGKKKL